jgi:NADP-dependent 3-hydroxy acid dehydrogenase YdfG
VITGASSGLGESTARLLASKGAIVVLGARRKDRINALAEDLTARGGRALGVRADVTNRSDVEALVKAAIDAYEQVDVIVNNAGACRLRQ